MSDVSFARAPKIFQWLYLGVVLLIEYWPCVVTYGTLRDYRNLEETNDLLMAKWAEFQAYKQLHEPKD